MHRFRKTFILIATSAVALFLTVRDQGQSVRVAAETPLAEAARPSGDYEMAQAQIFSKALYYVNNQYFDRTRPDPKRMLVGAMDFLQRDVPEVLVDRYPELDPQQITIRVNGEEKMFSIENVDSPWALSSTVKKIFSFVEPRLRKVSVKDRAKHLAEVEMTATNGMLYTLDPHSVLLDVESYKEMRTTTQGKFGGLGILIGVDRKGRITVRKPMLGYPAMKAGLKAKDRIVRINNESTMNMTLTEAVDRLRGDVGSSVDVYVERAEQKDAKKYTIVRDYIYPHAIDPPARVLSVPATSGQPPVKIGYFRIGSFSANADSEMTKALADFEKEKTKGIIMDLRGNPGGLYDQAQKIADAFIEQGVLVSMVGAGGAQRKDEHASRNSDTKIPLVVLINQTSASASEIVAGALKNLDRAVVMGETSFGKGSVQMLFDIPSPVSFGKHSAEDKLGLKLTTAQYLTPGDLSIQGVGVTPDIQLNRMRVEKKKDEAWISLQPSTRRRQEADYEWHLESPQARKTMKPTEMVSYLFVPPPGSNSQKALDEEQELDLDGEEEEAEDEPDADELRIDYPIEIARDFLAQVKSSRRSEALVQSKGFFDRARATEDKKLVTALEKLGVDWSPGTSQASGEVELHLSTVPENGKITAGETVKIRGTVKNTGKTTLHRVRALLQSDNLLFHENEMVFGKIAPGASKTYDLSVKVPKNSLTRTDVLSAKVSGWEPLRANAQELTLNIAGKTRPQFAYAYQTVDDELGNRDGLVQRGEQVRTILRVKNTGAGEGLRVEAILRNGSNQEGILITIGRLETKNLAPGETWDFSFKYEVRNDFQGEEYQLELVVADTILGESVSDKFKVVLSPNGAAPVKESGRVSVQKPNIPLRESPQPNGLIVGQAEGGSSFPVVSRVGDYWCVELEAGRTAFLAVADAVRGGEGPSKYSTRWSVTPPLLTVRSPTMVTGNRVHLAGLATDNTEVMDIFIRVWNRDSKLPPKKVFYLPNKGARSRLPFEADVPLWPGSNLIQVFARENNEVQSVQTLTVLSRPAPVQARK